MSTTLGPNETAVFSLLQQHSKPLSAYDILDQLHGTRIKAAVQVYRALEKLAHNGLVHRIDSLNAFVACTCTHGTSSPGFTVCTCCGDVREFDAGKTVTAVQTKIEGFRIDKPSLELKGVCSHCQSPDHSHDLAKAARP